MDKERIKIILIGEKHFDSNINVSGWVRTKRQSKNVSFISLNDGSTIKSLQVVLDMNEEFQANLLKVKVKIKFLS